MDIKSICTKMSAPMLRRRCQRGLSHESRILIRKYIQHLMLEQMRSYFYVEAVGMRVSKEIINSPRLYY